MLLFGAGSRSPEPVAGTGSGQDLTGSTTLRQGLLGIQLIQLRIND